MSMNYTKQHHIPIIIKITTRIFGSIKFGENFRFKYETKPFWVVNRTYKEQLVYDVFEKWKPIYFGILWFRKWKPKIDGKSMQVSIKTQLFRIKRKLVGTKKTTENHLLGKIK